MRRWITKRTFLWTFGAVLLLLAASITIPTFVPARFDSVSVPLSVRVQVTDRESGLPIEGATVRVPGALKDSVTGADGQCEVTARFRATGSVGRSGKMHLHGALRVTAPGYQLWESPFPSIFGARYDYFNHGSSVTQAVRLEE